MIPILILIGLVIGSALSRRERWMRYAAGAVAVGWAVYLVVALDRGPTFTDMWLAPVLTIFNVTVGTWLGWLVFHDRHRRRAVVE